MEQPQDNAPLHAGSEESLILPSVTQRDAGSNRRAFKVAGLTVLACLLLASQGLMAYMVYSQRGQISTLQKSSDSMRKKLTSRPQVAPVQMHLPMNTMPLLMDFADDGSAKKSIPLTKLEDTAKVTVTLEKQVKDLLQGSQLPQFNDTFLVNLKSLKSQMEESEWKGLETWMRQWLIFTLAQQAPPPPTPQSATTLQTKCSLLAAPGRVRPGFFQPQCDEQGRYKPLQCWHSTGYCWCVDTDGNEIPNTRLRGRPMCGGAPLMPAARSMAAFPRTLKMAPLLDDE